MQNSARRIHAAATARRTFLLSVFCILQVVVAVSLAACGARARAEAVADGPPLSVPIPPAHEIAIEQIAEAPPPEPVPAAEPAPPVPRPTVTRTPARQDPRPDTPAVTASPAPPSPPVVTEAPAVRAAPATSAADERKVRELMGKAAADLNRVDYKRLSAEGRAQYDQSKRFSEEAQAAIKAQNFVYALTLAEKAANIAAELVR